LQCRPWPLVDCYRGLAAAAAVAVIIVVAATTTGAEAVLTVVRIDARSGKQPAQRP
jgi:hypothetical protein